MAEKEKGYIVNGVGGKKICYFVMGRDDRALRPVIIIIIMSSRFKSF